VALVAIDHGWLRGTVWTAPLTVITGILLGTHRPPTAALQWWPQHCVEDVQTSASSRQVVAEVAAQEPDLHVICVKEARSG
jgi:hypothetical protein